MGEYAKLVGTGESIKIGTCEDMYYLRADQARQVWPQAGSVDPVKDRDLIRFRFPWPDEDHIRPGEFADPFRRRAIHGVTPPAELEHGKIQFVAKTQGYNVCLPCPEAPEVRDAPNAPYTVHRNGFAGAVFLVQQRYWEGQLVSVCDCACGARYRLPTLVDAEPVVTSLLEEAAEQLRIAERNDTPGNADVARGIIEIARRIVAGYSNERAELASRDGAVTL